MNKSETIAELAKALCKAQAVIEGAMKDKNNPAFRSKYADLAACWDAARKPLTDNGLSVMQFPRLTESGVEVETIVLHSSGEFMSETLGIPLGKRDAHGVGAAITYGRRFGFSALVGICPEDDDGNAAVGKGKHDDKEAGIASLLEQFAADWEVVFTDCADAAALETEWAKCKAACMKYGDGTQALLAVKPVYAKRYRALKPAKEAA